MLEFQSGGSRHESTYRPGLDIVAVLDASGNMEGEKLEKLKTAVQLLITNLSPFDRLSIVTFGTNAKRQCALWQVTENTQQELQYLIESLEATGHTNTLDGLLMGLKILKDRRLSEKRAARIILVSGGLQTVQFAKSTQVPVANVPVYAFGLGKGYDTKELKSIALKSPGGSFEDIQDMNGLKSAFSVCLDKLLKYSAVAEDLTVTIIPIKEQSTIEEVIVDGGQHQHTHDDADGSRTFKLGNVYSGNVRTNISVNLLLPVVRRTRDVEDVDILEVQFEYRFAGELQQCNPAFIAVRRIGVMGDEKTILKNACAKIVSTLNVLDDVKKQPLIRYLQSLDSQEIYQKLGRVFARALHDAKVHGTEKFTISARFMSASLQVCSAI